MKEKLTLNIAAAEIIDFVFFFFVKKKLNVIR